MKYIHMLLLSILTLGLHAQQQQPQEGKRFTLKEAVEYAKKNGYSQKNANQDVLAAQAKVRETRSVGLPRITAEGRFTYTPQIPIMVLPNTNGAFGPEPVIRFPQGIDYMATGNITATQLLFDGGFIMGLKAARNYEEYSKINAHRTSQETEVDVIGAYCNVLLVEEKIKMLDVAIKSIEATKKDLEAISGVGLVEKTEADRITIAYSNLLIDRKNAESGLLAARFHLNITLGLPTYELVVLTDSLPHLYKDAQQQELAIPDKISYINRPEYRSLDIQSKLNDLDKKRYQYAYGPTLAAFLTHQQNAFSREFNPLFKNFYPGTMLGINASLPIFDGFEKRSKIQQTKITEQKIANTKKQLEGAIDTEILISKTKYLIAKETIDQRIKNKELAEEIYKQINIKYQNGLSSSLDLVTADRDLKDAQQNYLQALYDLIIAKAELAKALGNIN